MSSSLTHYTSPSFWEAYDNLPSEIKKVAIKNFTLLKKQPDYPSLHFKKVKNYWSVRVGRRYRALGIEKEGNIIWFWIGKHSDYERLISLSHVSYENFLYH